jgi:hypothetical protein
MPKRRQHFCKLQEELHLGVAGYFSILGAYAAGLEVGIDPEVARLVLVEEVTDHSDASWAGADDDCVEGIFGRRS